MKKILAIDDQQDNLTTIEAVLKSNLEDCQLLTALSGKEGIQIAKEAQPDTILLDIIMPEIDGYEVCKKLKEDESTKHIPVIMITAIKTDSASRIKGLDTGADAFLSKPIEPAEFSAQIKVMLRIKEAEDKLRADKADLEKNVQERTYKLQESEKKYKALYNNAPLSYQSLDKNGNFIDVNPAWLKTLGYEKEEVITKNFKDFLHPDWKGHFEKNFPKFKQRGYVHDVQFKIQHKNGNYLDILFEGCIGYNPDGSFKQTYCVFQDITSRKQVEEEMQKLANVVKHNSELINISTLDGRMTFLNESGSKMLGIEPHEVDKVNIMEVIPDHLIELVEKELLPALMNSGSWEGNLQYRNIKSGKLTDVHARTFTVYDPNTGKPQFLANVSTDITERKKFEEALISSEERLKVIFEYAPDAIYLNDFKGNFIDGNKAAENILGYKKEELIGQSFLKLKLLSPKGLAKAAKNMAKNALGKKSGPDEFLLNRKDGSKIDMEISAYPVKIKNKTVVLGIARDISERKKAEHKILKHLYLNKQILETTQEGYLLANNNGNIINVNPSYCKIIGYSQNEILKMNIRDLQTGLSSEEVDKRIQKMFMMERGQFVTKHKHKDGHNVDLEVSISKMDVDGIPHIAAFMHDITERIKAEKKIKEALLKAEESEMLKSAFLANMSHEIRTPMNAIIGFSNLIADADTDEERKEFIRIINSNGEHLLQIINDIIDISQIETGIIKIENENVNINRIIDNVLDINKIKDKIKNKKIELFIKKSLADNKANILSDNQRLQQVLINLLDNAYKCTDTGKIEYGYTVIQDKDNTEFLEFFVKDTGRGIHKAKQKVIFDRFMQEEISATRTIGGTGLGLTIARAIIKALGGDIWVKSIPGKGSTFYFTIPHQTAYIIEENIKPTDKEITNLDNKTILVAEDTYDSFLLIEAILAETKVKIIRANNGLEAIDICKKNNNIDLVLMDIRMPELGGYEASIEIKKTRPELPIIAQTAYAVIGDKKTAIIAGCDDYIAKPISPDKLIEIVHQWLL